MITHVIFDLIGNDLQNQVMAYLWFEIRIKHIPVWDWYTSSEFLLFHWTQCFLYMVIRIKTTSINPDPWSPVAGGDTRVVIRTKIAFVNPDPWSPVAGIDTRVVIRTKTISVIPDPRSQVAGGYTQVIIRTKTTFVDPDPCVRWQADIPKWLFVQRQHLLILTHASGSRHIYPSDYPYKDNIC